MSYCVPVKVPHSAGVCRADCVVLGGGPAGSTFAALVAKYAPQLKVLVLEKARFPRWHIGESTIPVMNAVLRDLEVFDVLRASEAIQKIGVTLVWGRDRRPWSADFIDLLGPGPGAPGDPLVATEQGPPITAFNVRRDRFDQLLLDQARHFGAEVREGTRVASVERDPTGRPVAVGWEDDTGARGVVETPFVVDATGLSALLTRGRRETSDAVANFAVSGYLGGARWKITHDTGEPGEALRTAVFVATIPGGWLWYFPVAPDVLSVGAVTRRDDARESAQQALEGDLEGFLWQRIRSRPELASVTEGAWLRDDILPRGKRAAACQDWASWTPQPSGPGWCAVGDAALHVDPILSAGLTTALQSARHAAYTFLATHRAGTPPADALWRAYRDAMDGEVAALLQLGRIFYQTDEALADLRAAGPRSYTAGESWFLPWTKAISPEIVARLAEGLSEVEGVDLLSGIGDRGATEGPASDEALDRCRIRPRASFALGMRTEPAGPERPGALDVFWDIGPPSGTRAWAHPLGHRKGAVQGHVGPALRPLVEALAAGRYPTVGALATAAPHLVRPGTATPQALRRAARALVRILAKKGFLALEGER